MKKIILPDSNISTLFGPNDDNIKYLESLFNVSIDLRGSNLIMNGEEKDVASLEKILIDFARIIREGQHFSNGDLRSALKQIAEDTALSLHDIFPKAQILTAGSRRVTPKSTNQRRYVEAMRRDDIVFAIGPGGTGKTYLAVAMALCSLTDKTAARIVLTRPAVEAGEKLGFLPGGILEKIDPYLRPLYDALYHLMDGDRIGRLIEKNIIEIAPLAFMRGRTLSDAFIILDEAQNTTSEQMKMFLTRLGFNSKAVITGDVTQIDLPMARQSGLVEAQKVLSSVAGISFCFFDESDVVRHRLVRLIIRAYKSFAGQGRSGANADANPSRSESAR